MSNSAAHTALLVMDVQRGVVERFAGAGELQSRLARAVDTARGAAVPLIFVRVAFRAGHPEVSVNNRSFSALASQAGTRFTDDSEATQIHPAVGPLDGDLVVVKKRVSAFSGSDLEVLLRSLDVTHLVLTGIATSGVVLSTLREAADKDYRLTVLADGCLDVDEEVHRVLIEKVFLRQAEVVSVDEWASRLSSG